MPPEHRFETNVFKFGRGIDWGGEPGKNCYNETTLIEDPNYWGSDCRKGVMRVIGEVFSRSKFPITFLNITQLSNYRKDAHTSIYKKQWNALTPEQLANPSSYADCVHWCLPGLQDTWNELLFAKLFYPWICTFKLWWAPVIMRACKWHWHLNFFQYKSLLWLNEEKNGKVRICVKW